MDFEFSESQQQLKEEARKFLSAKSSIKVVRSVLDSTESYDRALWSDLAQLGFLATSIPEKYGGAGGGYLELCAIAEEMGRALAPVPFSSSIYLAAGLLLEAGTETQKATYLPEIASGKTVACVAFSETVGQPRMDAIKVVVRAGRLSGVKLPVLDGDVADIAIVLARDASVAESPVSLFIVNLRGGGVSRTALRTIDPTRGQARVEFHDCVCEPLGVAGQGGDLLSTAFDRAAILLAFEQVGGAERALEMARDYSIERVAFGSPIGSFQAIKHKLVDMYTSTVLARSNAYFGAWAVSAGTGHVGLAAASARVSASHAFQYCSTEACHIFGAMGFTWESDCHLFFRRARLLSLVLGGQRMWGDRLIECVKRQGGALRTNE